MIGLVLVGHFLTRSQAARAAGVSKIEISLRPDLLRIGGVWAEEVYFAWQFCSNGVDPVVGRVIRLLKGEAEDAWIADWMCRSQPDLRGLTPLVWLASTGDAEAAVLACKKAVAQR